MGRRIALSLSSLALALGFAAQASADANSFRHYVQQKGQTSRTPPASPEGGCGTQEITLSTSQAITALNSVSCNDGFGHTDNSYWRAFPTAMIPAGFNVCEVEVGIEEAASSGGTQPITVRLYRQTAGQFPAAGRVQVGTQNFNIADQSLTIFDAAVVGTVPAGEDLIVEVFTPNGQATGNLFFIGSNAAAENGPSYLSAPDCGVVNPTTTAAIGFPNMHIVMNVRGTPAVAGPAIAEAGASLVAEGCSPGNGAIDPNELVTVSLCIQNNGTLDTVNAVGTLQATGGVTSPSGPQNYGVVVAGGADVCRDFSFTASGSCGETITASLQVQDGATDLGTVTYDFLLGALGAPVAGVYSTGNIAVPIIDLGTINVPINVADTGFVSDIDVQVRLNHTWDGDLDLELVAPDNTVIPLVQNRGGSGDNFGIGANDCSGTPTELDDASATPISAGAAPFVGIFSPEQPLAGFNGFPSNGTWNLRVRDEAGADVGVVGCVTLQMSRQTPVCCIGCTLTCPADVGVGNDPNQCGAAVTLPATGGSCTNVTCVPPSGSFFPVGTTVVTCDDPAATAPCSFNVTVNDVEAPVLTCPADIFEDLPPGVPSGPVSWSDPTVADNCPNPGAPNCVPPSGSDFPGGQTTPVTCTATDTSGNTGTCAFNVTLGLVSILEIPTASTWGLAALALLLAGAAFFVLRRNA